MKRESDSTERSRENISPVDAVIVGASILDIPAGPVDRSVFAVGSHPVEAIRMYTGGDALNESIILSRLGKRVHLVSRIGEDTAGSFILEQCRREAVDTDGIRQIAGLDTGINLVLVSADGERSFVTASGGSLRKQEPSDVVMDRIPRGRIFMLASIFVYPRFTVQEMERIFREAKEAGYLVCADMTKRKHGETLADIAPALRYVDYIFPNLEEAALVAGLKEPEEIISAFLDAGVGHIVLKLGREGCAIGYRPDKAADENSGAIQTAEAKPEQSCQVIYVPAVPGIQARDTTGAGDTFAAAFLCGLLEGKTLSQCAEFANAAASITVEAFGATTGLQTRAQVEQRLAASKARFRNT